MNNNNINFEAIAYTDGSYKDKIFTYGLYFQNLKNNSFEEINEKFNELSWSKLQNVAGEIMGVIKAIQLCIDSNLKSILIYYDYSGLQKWVNGEWKAKNEKTKLYRNFVLEAEKKIEIKFQWVKAHNGNINNEKAHNLANDAYFLTTISKPFI